MAGFWGSAKHLAYSNDILDSASVTVKAYSPLKVRAGNLINDSTKQPDDDNLSKKIAIRRPEKMMKKEMRICRDR